VLFECLCRLTALAAEPLLRQMTPGQHADADTNDAVRDKAMDVALDAWGALLRDIRAKAMAVALSVGPLRAVRLSSVDELLGQEMLDAGRTHGVTLSLLRSLLLHMLGDLVAQTKPDATFIALPLSLSLDRAATARLILETAVGGVNTRQVAVASEDSERRSVTHLELLRSSKNRLETLAIAGFPAFGAPGNCRF